MRSGSRSRSRPSSTASPAKPYGWDLASIEVLIAYLIGTSKVTLTVDGNVLKRSEVATALRNTQKHAHAVVVAPEDVRRAQGRCLPQVLHRLLRRRQYAQGPAGAGPPRCRQARRPSATSSRPPSPVRSTRSSSQLSGPDRPARPGGRQARRLVPDRLQPGRRSARCQGDPRSTRSRHSSVVARRLSTTTPPLC